MATASRSTRLLLCLAAMTLAAPAALAQVSALEVRDPQNTRLLFLDTVAGFLVQGQLDADNLVPPASGPGTRLMWWPARSAFRAGTVGALQWDSDQVGDFSTAMGLNALASGFSATAFGFNATANGYAATAVGEGTTASSIGTFAAGSGTSASGDHATALGLNTVASGAYATALGRITSATGESSTAMGYFSEASGQYSTALGLGGRATARAATAMGSQNWASAEGATAMGISTRASGPSSTALGNGTVASGVGSTALGSMTTASGPFSVAAGDFSTADGSRSMVFGTFLSSNNFNNSIVMGGTFTAPTEATAHNQFVARFSGGYRLYTASTGTTTGVSLVPGGGSWASLSDSTHKERFRPYDPEAVLAGLRSLRLGTWNYRGQDPATMRHWGPMAQDFHRAFGHDGVGTVGTDTTISTLDADGVLFAAAQALEARTRDLEARIDALETERRRERSLAGFAVVGLLGLGLGGVAVRRRRPDAHS